MFIYISADTPTGKIDFNLFMQKMFCIMHLQGVPLLYAFTI